MLEREERHAMSAINDAALPKKSWLRRNRESLPGLRVVGDVPPDLADSADENGSLVTVDPVDWILLRARPPTAMVASVRRS